MGFVLCRKSFIFVFVHMSCKANLFGKRDFQTYATISRLKDPRDWKGVLLRKLYSTESGPSIPLKDKIQKLYESFPLSGGPKAVPTEDWPLKAIKRIPLEPTRYPEPRLTLSRGMQSNKLLDVLKFASDGAYSSVLYPLSHLQGVHARDLLNLDLFKPSRDILGFRPRQLPAILPRDNCIIISISHIKAIILHDHVLLLDSQRPVVKHFADFLKNFLQKVHMRENPLFALHNDSSFGLKKPDDDDTAALSKDTEVPMDFEFRVLEAILSFAVTKYARRIQIFEPIVNELLDQLLLKATHIEFEVLFRLLPISNSLGSFERSTNEVSEVLRDLLANEEDMLQMFLSQKNMRFGQLPPSKQHEDLELLLESYLRELIHLNSSAFTLRKKIQTSQDLVNVALDNYRNRMMHTNVQMAISSVCLSIGTVGVGIFGMNLPSGLEGDPFAFWVMSGLCVGTIYAVFSSLSRRAWLSPTYTTNVTELKSLQPFLDSLGDIQDIMLSKRPWESLDKAQLQAILEEATDRSISPVDVQLVFAVFDKDQDGLLTREDQMRFLADVHNRHSAMSSTR